MKQDISLSCPVPHAPERTVTLAHGSGGRLMHKLIADIFLKAFDDPALHEAHDGARLEPCPDRLAFTTDSFVVRPMFFPGGDIGSLAVHGTCNDLAMCGAQPMYLSCGFIIEEGLCLDALEAAAKSMAAAAAEVGARIVTGDTKVVERGKGDGIYINTAGVGRIVALNPVSPQRVRPGHAVIVSGDVGAHGAAILSVREGLAFETGLKSDAGHLWPAVRELLEADVDVACLRDLTRGGLATTLNEIAAKASCCISIDEEKVPVRREVEGACEMFGLDPLYMACEGRLAAFVPPDHADRALAALKAAGCAPVVVGSVNDRPAGEVRLKTRIGVERVLDMLSGEQLPRIC
ncbi:MAG: hydrogenase expression/formation protein HypE [Elusimicrobia bacterium]|nr:hydrogenase expression/formation protein HypE [Elusimicrobiota bacterium]